MIEVREAPPEHYGWLAHRAQLVIAPNFRAIEAFDRDRILGMVGYDGWTDNSCTMHVAIDKPIAVRRLLRTGFEIPFLRLNRGVVLASVLSTNSRSLKFTEHMGFRRRVTLRDAWAVGVDMVIYELRREHCRFLR